MAENLGLPEGFVLDKPSEMELPEGFVLDEQVTETQPTSSNLGGILTGLGLGGGAVAGAGYGVRKGYQALAPQRTKMAGGLINSIIKPKHKEYMFGKNPGQAVAQEGIWGVGLEGIGRKVNERLTQLNTYAKELRSLDVNKTKTVNFQKVLDPLYEALDEFSKAPKTHRAKINEVYRAVSDIEGNLPKGIDINQVPVETAYGVKKVVEGMQKWNVESSGDHILNSKLKQVYHNVDNAIDTVIPELKSTNSRIANLISAKQSIKNRMEVLSRQDSTSLGNLASLPIKATIGSTAIKSGIAKILAEKFGVVGKIGQKVGKVGRQALPTLSVVTSILDAVNFSQDPEAYMYRMETGQELSPKGSEEREIQLGRLI